MKLAKVMLRSFESLFIKSFSHATAAFFVLKPLFVFFLCVILYQPLHQIKHVLPSKHWKLKVSNDESSFWKCKCILARKS